MPSQKANENTLSTSSFKTFNTTLNQGGLKDTREKNLAEAFKILIGSQETLVEKSPSSSPAPRNGDFFSKLIQQLKAKIIDMYLIQTIEDIPSTLYKINGLLAQLNKPEVPNSIVNFIIDFELFLE